MTDVILEARDVRKTYLVGGGLFRPKGTLHAVNGVSLKVEKGAVLGIVGESGCGKSTLARMLLGLETPTSGEVLIGGVPAGTLDRKAIARHIQPIFQDPYSSLNPRKRVESIISLPLRVHGIGAPKDRRRRTHEMMDLVGLSRRLSGSYPMHLSGGQRQRVTIARALIMRPEIVICDEPTSALDVSVQSQILNLLQELRRELGLTYVLISHNLAVVEHMATRVAVMYLGQVIEEAETRELFARPRHPYTQALLASVLTPEPALGVPDVHLGAGFPDPIDPPPGCSFHPRCPEATALCSRLAPRSLMVGATRVKCHLHDREAMEAEPCAAL